MKITGSVIWLVLVWLCGTASVVFAQGKIIGRVTDSDGKPVPGANIYISGPVTMANLSNAGGYFVFVSIPQGNYIIKAAKRGLPEWKSTIAITSDLIQRQDIRLTDESSNKNAVVVAKRKAPEPIVQPGERTDRLLRPSERVATEEAAADSTVDEEVLFLAAESISDEAEQVAIAEALKEAEDAFAAMATMPITQAEIEGGLSSIYDKIVYPEIARWLRIEGKVVARVFVDSNGKPSRVDFLKPAHDVLNREVLRVLAEETQYKPAKVGARSVGSIIVVPVKFSLGN